MIIKCDKHYYYKDNIVLCQLRSAAVSERAYVQNHSYENVFRLQVHFHANQTDFRLDGLVQYFM